VPPVKATAFKLRHRPVDRPVAKVLAAFDDREMPRASNDLVDVPGKFRPVCRDAKAAAWFELAGREFEKGILHDAPLVVPFLRPGIRKVQVDAGKCVVTDAMFENLECVITDQPDIADASLKDFQKAMANAGFMHFDADKIVLRMSNRLLNQRLAVTETNFQHACGVAAEHRVQVKPPVSIVDTE